VVERKKGSRLAILSEDMKKKAGVECKDSKHTTPALLEGRDQAGEGRFSIEASKIAHFLRRNFTGDG